MAAVLRYPCSVFLSPSLRNTTLKRSLSSSSVFKCTNSLVPVPKNELEKVVERDESMSVEKDSSWNIRKETLNKFIPVTRQLLVKTLVEDKKMWSLNERENIENLSAGLDTCISQQFYSQLDDMKVLYDNLDPDKDTIQSKRLSTKELLNDEYWLLQKLTSLLYKANFVQIPHDRLIQLLQEHGTAEGVRVSVDPRQYEVLRIWTRGLKTPTLGLFERIKVNTRKLINRRKNSTQNLRGDFGDIDKVFTRVFIAMRSKREKKLHFKVFKDVPSHQLEYLLPDGKIKMSNFDKGFLTSSVFLGSLVLTAKMITLASDYHMDYLWVGLGFAGLIGARGWLGYKNKRNSYLVNLSRTLYFKTVSNNRGVLTLLTDRAQDEEFKESLLAYLFLLSPANRRGIPGLTYTEEGPLYDTPITLQTRIEKWLSKKLSITGVHFDISDALAKLDSMGLLVRHADETLSVVPMGVALETLPKSPLQWTSLGGLRESGEDNNETIDNETLTFHKGWR